MPATEHPPLGCQGGVEVSVFRSLHDGEQKHKPRWANISFFNQGELFVLFWGKESEPPLIGLLKAETLKA